MFVALEQTGFRGVMLTRLCGAILAMLVPLAQFCVPGRALAADVVMTEPQVKALCILNFAKYVNWPPHAFSETNGPIRIGIFGDPEIFKELSRAVQNKSIAGRSILAIEVENPREMEFLHVLFIGAAEKARTPEVLASLGQAPTLTVGEIEGFTDAGGIMVFVKRENKVRFEVNLAPARIAGLQISSRLLALADSVRGKE